MSKHNIETRFHHDACDLRDALLDAGFEPSEIEGRGEGFTVETNDVARLRAAALQAADTLSIAVWVDGLRAALIATRSTFAAVAA